MLLFVVANSEQLITPFIYLLPYLMIVLITIPYSLQRTITNTFFVPLYLFRSSKRRLFIMCTKVKPARSDPVRRKNFRSNPAEKLSDSLRLDSKWRIRRKFQWNTTESYRVSSDFIGFRRYSGPESDHRIECPGQIHIFIYTYIYKSKDIYTVYIRIHLYIPFNKY